jgi:hypothetical protein
MARKSSDDAISPVFRHSFSALRISARKFGSVHTLAGGIKGTHVEDVNALHLSDEFQTLETGGLLEIGGDCTGLSTRGEEVVLDLDLYMPG